MTSEYEEAAAKALRDQFESDLEIHRKLSEELDKLKIKTRPIPTNIGELIKYMRELRADYDN